MGTASCTMLSHCFHHGLLFLTKLGQLLCEAEHHIHYVLGCQGKIGRLGILSPLLSHKEAYNQAIGKSVHDSMAHSDDPLKKKETFGKLQRLWEINAFNDYRAWCFIPHKLHGRTPWCLRNKRICLVGLHYSFQRSPSCLLVFTCNPTKNRINVMCQTLELSWSHSSATWWCSSVFPV